MAGGHRIARPETPREQLAELGRDLRSNLSRRGQADLTPLDRDPVPVLSTQDAQRIPGLVPLRFGRMIQSPFAYYRGAAAVMTGDLARQRTTGPRVVGCGDAHVGNFGPHSSLDGRHGFDLTDFDEAGLAPWEWDLKRLATSVAVVGRDAAFPVESIREAVRFTVSGYRQTLRQMMEMTIQERFYHHIETEAIVKTLRRKKGRGPEQTERVRQRTADRVLDPLVIVDEGGPSIVEQPPITRRVAEVDREALTMLFEQYRSTVRADIAQLLSQFSLTDFVLRVVGVGSVGTRCFIALLIGPAGETLFLQVKEASRSVLETHGGITQILPDRLARPLQGHQGYRVVACQRILQADTDPFLAWISVEEEGPSGPTTTDYYWRQFREKGSIDVTTLTASQIQAYGGLSADLLARAHAQSPHGQTVAAYMGHSEVFDEAVTGWAMAYSDQVERDHEALVKAVRRGDIPVEEEV